jgi:hypothetical protein
MKKTWIALALVGFGMAACARKRTGPRWNTQPGASSSCLRWARHDGTYRRKVQTAVRLEAQASAFMVLSLSSLYELISKLMPLLLFYAARQNVPVLIQTPAGIAGMFKP